MSQRATLSTHVLDVATGRPAGGVRVSLGTRTLTTDDNGRIADLSNGGLEAGDYTLVFEIGPYFGSVPHLFETVTLEITLAEARHYHVPLLISPFSCSSYRGS
jgi:5-hydroxyisourate hydrolase